MRILAELLWGEDPYVPPASMPPNIELTGDMFQIFPKDSTPQSWTCPAGKVSTGDAMLFIMAYDANVPTPTFTAPATTTILAQASNNKTTFPVANTASTTIYGASTVVGLSTVASETDTFTWSTKSNPTIASIWFIPLPARFATCPRQVMGMAGSPHVPAIATGTNSVTFTAPFNGYFFVIQASDVASAQGGSVPGTTVPYTDLTYGMGMIASTGTWKSPGTFIVPDAIQKVGGVVNRVDYSYLSSGTTVTVQNEKLSNSQPTGGQHLIVIGFDTTQ